MERTAWADERLGDLPNRMDAGFARVDADIRELRAELRVEIGGPDRAFGKSWAGWDRSFEMRSTVSARSFEPRSGRFA